MSEVQQITEEMGVHKKWYTQAREQTLDTLPEFMRHVLTDYGHDYGTICHAVAACSVAAAWAADSAPQGGITGFQASAVMWQFVQGWLQEDGPMTLLKWENALYPQYEDKFTGTISRDTLAWLQTQAREKLAEPDRHAHITVRRHWKALAAGKPPFGLRVVE